MDYGRRMTTTDFVPQDFEPPTSLVTPEFVLEPLFVREDFGRPLEFVGHHLPEDLERRLDRALPDGVTMRDLAEGGGAIL